MSQESECNLFPHFHPAFDQQSFSTAKRGECSNFSPKTKVPFPTWELLEGSLRFSRLQFTFLYKTQLIHNVEILRKGNFKILRKQPF